MQFIWNRQRNARAVRVPPVAQPQPPKVVEPQPPKLAEPEPEPEPEQEVALPEQEETTPES